MGKRRILIVDDEQAFARLLKLALERTGDYEVRVENAGTRALSAAQQFAPDLVLLDVIMPDMEGGKVAAQLRTDPALATVPIVFLTAIVSTKELPVQGALVGGFPFIAKPATAGQVIQCLERHLPPPQEPAALPVGQPV